MHRRAIGIVVTVSALAVGVAFGAEATTRETGAADGGWRVKVDFSKPIRPFDPRYAGANVNSVGNMLDLGEEFDAAVAGLGFRFMRFQCPAGKTLDYHGLDSWTDEDFAVTDRGVQKALATWGVKDLLFGIHRVQKPLTEDGRLIVEDFDAYAAACAKLVQRYAPKGRMRVKYWEPFNELDHPNRLEEYHKHGQGLADVAELFNRCAAKMKAVNPEIVVGGPALVESSEGAVEAFLKHAGETAEFLSWHEYSTGNAATSDAEILRSVLGPKRFLAGVQRIEQVVRRAGRPDVPMFLDEFHINYAAWRPPDVRTATQFSAVFAASVLANLSQTQVTSVMIHDLISRHYGLVGPARSDRISRELGLIADARRDESIHIRPVGWVYRWFNELAGGQWVETQLRLPAEAREHERGRLLDACAWRNGDRRTVMLVNKDETAHEVEVDFGAPVPSEGFELPLRVLTVANDKPRETQTSGTREGKWRWELAAMSVTFIAFEHPAD